MEEFSNDLQELEAENKRLREENEVFQERLEEMESRMAELITMFEQTLEKAEQIGVQNEILENRCYELSSENHYLANALQNVRDSYLNLFKAHDYNQNELRELRRILMELKGFEDNAALESWLEEVSNKELDPEFQA